MDHNEFQKLNKEYLINETTLLYGITPRLGSHIAERFKNLKVLETCGGAGFLTIELAKVAKSITSVEINEEHQRQAKYNLQIAKLNKNIKFIKGDILDETIQAQLQQFDAAVLDPAWHDHVLSHMSPPAVRLFQTIAKITKNILLILPPAVEEEIKSVFPEHELEKLYLDGELSLLCLYFGNLARTKTSLFEPKKRS